MAVTTDRASPLCSSVSARRGSWVGIPTIWYPDVPDARLGGKAYSYVLRSTLDRMTKNDPAPIHPSSSPRWRLSHSGAACHVSWLLAYL